MESLLRATIPEEKWDEFVELMRLFRGMTEAERKEALVAVSFFKTMPKSALGELNKTKAFKTATT